MAGGHLTAQVREEEEQEQEKHRAGWNMNEAQEKYRRNRNVVRQIGVVPESLGIVCPPPCPVHIPGALTFFADLGMAKQGRAGSWPTEEKDDEWTVAAMIGRGLGVLCDRRFGILCEFDSMQHLASPDLANEWDGDADQESKVQEHDSDTDHKLWRGGKDGGAMR
ncbi:hypothetical protein CSOJ01_00280 [Colletotrichum sojae]|uniref:Uncharacterized protein n=1 Tax=Colletotrichum sojae TaxID=2175907 RepID=A0A8H6JXI3_9PEZI|nr:hypothetical protein CSOJ01_00280 [Colletotrichum sojae]